MLKLPGLIDPHVHVREPGATHKEDWDTATQAALAGGFTTILAMPNTSHPIFDRNTLDLGLRAAKLKARCDYAQYLGAGPQNTGWNTHPNLPQRAAGLKMYLDSTYGELRLDDLTLWMQHFANYPKNLPIVAHAEKQTMAAAILMAELYDRPLHIAHVSRKEEILLIKKAKERGIHVTCEVTPHHLFLTDTYSPPLVGGARGAGERKSAPASPLKQMWMPSGKISMSLIASPPTTPHIPLKKKMAKIRPPASPGWKPLCRFCSPRSKNPV